MFSTALAKLSKRAASSQDALRSYQKAEDLGARNGDPNAGVFKRNADRVRARLAEKALEKTARP